MFISDEADGKQTTEVVKDIIDLIRFMNIFLRDRDCAGTDEEVNETAEMRVENRREEAHINNVCVPVSRTLGHVKN